MISESDIYLNKNNLIKTRETHKYQREFLRIICIEMTELYHCLWAGFIT